MNVRWALKIVQNRNTRKNVYLTANNETHCVAEWAEILNLNPLLIAKRKRAGWPDDECLGFKDLAPTAIDVSPLESTNSLLP